MAKKDFKVKFFAGGREIEMVASSEFYGVTDEFIRVFLNGAVWGLYQKYIKPSAKAYEITPQGEILRHRCN